MQIDEVLSKLNLEGKKGEVYLACLETHGATAYALSQKVGIKRPTVYDILDSLLKEGLVYISLKKGAKHFYAADPERILFKLKNKEAELLSVMPFLQNLYNSPAAKPVIRYFEGLEGIKEMYSDSLKTLSKGGEILVYSGQDVLKNLPEFTDEYITERIRKGIRVKGIYKKTSEISGYMENNQKQLRTVRLVEAKSFPMNNEINIYADKIAIASYGQEMLGILIESKEIVEAQRAIFNLAWLGAEHITEII
jgi:sugar-specific transcriptional regulator TrmB